MVDEDWVEMIKDDVATHVKGTFLEGKPVVCVSAYTGQGIPELKQMLQTMVLNASEKNMRTPFRLPVDRVFSVEGFGTVVTGTLVEGCVCTGDAAVIYPDGTECRVRNIQVHSKDVSQAYAGQRVAINLAGVKKDEIKRGASVAAPGSSPVSMMLDVRLENLPDSGRTIVNNSQLHLYHGSSEHLTKVVLLDRDSLEPGQTCLAQLRLSEDISSRKGDRFVVRFFSPLETIGGGCVIDPKPYRHKRNDQQVLDMLALKESGSEEQKLVQHIAEQSFAMVKADAVMKYLNCSEDEAMTAIAELSASGKVVELLSGEYIAASCLDQLYNSAEKLLADYHAAYPLQAGMKKAELKQKLLGKLDMPHANALFSWLVREDKLKSIADRYCLSSFEVKLTKKQKSLKDKLLKIYAAAAYEAPTLEELQKEFQPGEKNEIRQLVDNMLSEGLIIMLAPGVSMEKAAFEKVCEMTAAYFETHSELALADFRDMLNTSRKYALYILEYFDINKILKKEGDVRRLEKGFK